MYKMSEFSFLSAEERRECKYVAKGYVSETQRQCEFLVPTSRNSTSHFVKWITPDVPQKILNIHVQ